ncbi:hypothetical protein [Egicoccus sp. AB-alg2]|uniref:hypothetical protein n=1 Tax=Egicoccus sp. AB-alg2 TaxID=3242693 RepID=UPI00359DAC74
MDATPTGVISNVALLDLTSLHEREELEAIARIDDVAVILVRESLAGALARIPTTNVASIVPIADGARTQVHTGGVVMSGEALAAPDNEDAVLVVTGSLLLSSPVPAVTYRGIVVTGVVLAPFGSETALGSGLTRVTGAVQYFRHVEGQRFRTLSGQSRISGAFLANAGGDPGDVLFVAGQTIVTGEVDAVGFQLVVAAGQLLLPRASEAVLAPVLTAEGQLVWYGGSRPRFFLGNESFGRDFFEALDDGTALVLVGDVEFADDVTPEVLRGRIEEITLVGRLSAPDGAVGVVQALCREKHGTIVPRRSAGAPG